MNQKIRYKITAAASRIPLPLLTYADDRFALFPFKGWKKPLNIPYFAPEGMTLPWVSHNFWILSCEDEKGNVEEIESFHGFATEMIAHTKGKFKKRILLVGQFNAVLQVYCVRKKTSYLKKYWLEADLKDKKVAYGHQEMQDDALKLWHRAHLAKEEMNRLYIPYPAYGLGPSLGLYNCTNSNAVFSTLGKVMGLSLPPFDHWQPGRGHILLSKRKIAVLMQYPKKEE